MKLHVKGRILEVRHAKGVNYITANDTEQGGSFQLSIEGTEGAIPLDALIDFHVEVKPGIGKYGMYLKVVRNLSESDAKGEK